jgi:t-SNARE complex subunit (syntaxin)
MLRQKYQEQFFRSAKIHEIQKDTQEIFYLFEEIMEEVKQQERKLATIEESIEESVDNTTIGEIQINESKELKENNILKNIYGAIIGGGIGSIIIIYNPYIAIGAIIGGTIMGGLITKLF